MDDLQVGSEGPHWSHLLFVFEPSCILLIGDLNSNLMNENRTETLSLDTLRSFMHVELMRVSLPCIQALPLARQHWRD
jgi:hypothetical protein